MSTTFRAAITAATRARLNPAGGARTSAAAHPNSNTRYPSGIWRPASGHAGVQIARLPWSLFAGQRQSGARGFRAVMRRSPFDLKQEQFAWSVRRQALVILATILLAAALAVTAAIGTARNPGMSGPALPTSTGIPADVDDYVEGLTKLGITNVGDHSEPLRNR